MSNSQTDLQTNSGMVSTGKDNQVTAMRMRDFQYTTLGKIIIYRLLHNRDIKIVITSRGTTTGTGKTTLAIILARTINRLANEIHNKNNEWDASESSFVDVWQYLNKYKNANQGDVLLTDELEYLADNRRSMSSQNVYFSQAWAMLRYKNVITIGTAPGLHSLDKRIPENADIWINVLYQGRANTYYLTVDDFSGMPVQKRLKTRGFKESLVWGALPENDPDYQALHQEKKDIGVPGQDDENSPDLYEEKDLENARREIKRSVAIDLLERKRDGKLDLSQAEIGDITGYSQQNIYKIKREEL